jgi:large subunit ribosomal protein L10
MPSESILNEKKKIVVNMTERLKSQAGVFVDYKGITVNEDTEMRVKMREANVDYSVIKNSLMRLAIKNVGFDELDSVLVGTTSLATSAEDPIAPARIIKEYADKLTKYFEIKAGFMDGKVLSVDEVNAIASIPALPILQAQFLGTLLAPITSLAVVLKAAAEKGGAPADADVEVAADEATDVPVATDETAETTADTPVETVADATDEASVETVAVEEAPVADAVTEEPAKE